MMAVGYIYDLKVARVSLFFRLIGQINDPYISAAFKKEEEERIIDDGAQRLDG